MNGRMKNLVAVVTGGGSGFGESICGRFADQGARVVVADVDAPAGERVARSLRARGHEALFAAMDVSCSRGWVPGDRGGLGPVRPD